MNISRHVSREIAVQVLYIWFFFKEEKNLSDILQSLQDEYLPYSDKDLEFTSSIIEGVQEHLEQINTYIETYAPGWPISKIDNVDRAILSIGAYEVAFVEDLPHAIAINEAIELAKKFGGSTSSKFVNGVLHALKESLTS